VAGTNSARHDTAAAGAGSLTREGSVSETRVMSDAQAVRGMPRGRARNIALWVVQVLLAVFFVLAAIPKLAGLEDTVRMFARIGAGQWFRYFTGSLELAGAVGLLIPRLSGPAALGLTCVMVGAVFTQLFILTPLSAALLPAAVGVVLILVVWGRWSRIRALISKLTRAAAPRDPGPALTGH
jgi:putative oxidoreductase